MALKFGRKEAYHEGLPFIKPHDLIIAWPYYESN